MEENTEKNKKMMILIVGLLLILLIVIIVVSIFFLNVFKNNLSGNNKEVQSSEGVTLIETELISLSEPINTNLLSENDGRERVVSVNLSLAVNNVTKQSNKVINLIKNSEPVVRDVVISILREKTYTELKSIESKDIIKEEILTKLQDEFKTNLIVKVYLSGLYVP